MRRKYRDIRPTITPNKLNHNSTKMKQLKLERLNPKKKKKLIEIREESKATTNINRDFSRNNTIQRYVCQVQNTSPRICISI